MAVCLIQLKKIAVLFCTPWEIQIDRQADISLQSKKYEFYIGTRQYFGTTVLLKSH